MNAYWADLAKPAILHTGKLGTTVIRRPQGQLIYDLTAIDRHRFHNVVSLAHAMCHQRDDVEPYRKASFEIGATARRFRQCLAEVCHATLYGLPVNVGLRPEYSLGSYYGNYVTTDTDFKSPRLKVYPQELELNMVTSTLVAVLIHPHPAGLSLGTGVAAKGDEFCCLPTLLCPAGWATMPKITAAGVVDPPYGDQYYELPVSDLEDPRQYYDAVAMGREIDSPDQVCKANLSVLIDCENRVLSYAHNNPGLNDRELCRHLDSIWMVARQAVDWVYPSQLYDTGYFRWLVDRTPAWPCRTCMAFNRNTESVPERPKGRLPEEAIKDWPQDWIRYKQDLNRVYDIVDKAWKRFESRLFGTRAAAEARKTIKLAVSVRKESNYNRGLVLKGVKKLSTKGGCTPAEYRAYKQYEHRLQNSLPTGFVPITDEELET